TPADPLAGSAVAVSGRGLPGSAPVRISLSKSSQPAFTGRIKRGGALDTSVAIPAAANGSLVIRVRIRGRKMRLPVTVRPNVNGAPPSPNGQAPPAGQPQPPAPV